MINDFRKFKYKDTLDKVIFFITILIVILIMVFTRVNFKAFGFNDNIIINKNTANSLNYEKCKLIKVLDGDTLFVEINDKKEYVRLLNVDTPESINPDLSLNTEEGEEASNFVKEFLKDYKTLYLTKDKNDRDKYGRLLRLVWLKMPVNDSKEEMLDVCLNAILVKEKIAKVVVFDDYKYYDVLNEIEDEYNN